MPSRLSAAYAACRAVNAEHGRSYYLATRLLPPERRPAIHALYAFARVTDDAVDHPGADPAAALDEAEACLKAALAGRPPTPVLAAVADTVERHGIAPEAFTAFLRSMRMDLTVTDYPDLAALGEYMRGSAEAIGVMTLPVLGAVVPLAEAEPYARRLGEAFQLTNFLRDVGEDLDRGRVYLPADHLAAFGVDRERLLAARAAGTVDRPIRRAVAHLAAYTRSVYRAATPGIAMLDPVSRPCVAAAHRLYAAILDEIAAADHDVLTRRAVVPTRRRLAIALPGVARVVAARAGNAGTRRGVRRPGPGRGA